PAPARGAVGPGPGAAAVRVCESSRRSRCRPRRAASSSLPLGTRPRSLADTSPGERLYTAPESRILAIPDGVFLRPSRWGAPVSVAGRALPFPLTRARPAPSFPGAPARRIRGREPAAWRARRRRESRGRKLDEGLLPPAPALSLYPHSPPSVSVAGAAGALTGSPGPMSREAGPTSGRRVAAARARARRLHALRPPSALPAGRDRRRRANAVTAPRPLAAAPARPLRLPRPRSARRSVALGAARRPAAGCAAARSRLGGRSPLRGAPE